MDPLMRWEWEGGAVLVEEPTVEDDAERADEDDRDDEVAVSRRLCAGARG